jgi:hypothetical protein
VTTAPDITLTTINGQTVLFSKQTGDFFGLNTSAAHMIQCLLDTDFQTAATRCATDFHTPQETIETDLLELINELVALKLLRKEGPSNL